MCNFDAGENDLCDMMQLSNDRFDWSWVSYASPNELTGPSWGQTPPGYVFIDSALHPQGDLAK